MGFLGLWNYEKPGRGVKKDEPKPNRFLYFFQIYFRQFSKIIKLNLLYILFCIPVITIGPATAALTKIAKCYAEEKPFFLFSEFWDAFKSNFKQGLIIGILDTIILICLIMAFYFYNSQTLKSKFYYIPLGIITLLFFIYIFSNFYIYLEMVTVELPVLQLIKNSILFAFLGMKTNFLTIIFCAIIFIPSFLYFPLTIPVILLLLFSTMAVIICFNSFQYIYRYMVKPYYNQHPELTNPYEPENDE